LGALSPFHWLILLAIVVVLVWPIVIILKRMGFSGWWAALFFIPLGNVIGLWLLAKARWPRLDSQTVRLTSPEAG
jgi:hypothetical protein